MSEISGFVPGRRLLVLALAGVLLAGIAVIGVTRLLTDTPRSAVSDYFEALGRGDAEDALDRVFLGDDIDLKQYPLLTSAALGKRFRPKGVSIGSPVDADPSFGRRSRIVPVSYTASGSSVSHRILVVQDDDDHYRLRGPFVTIGLAGALGRTVLVNGVGLPAQGEVVGFPGAFQASAAANTLLTASTAAAVPAETAQGGYLASLDLGTPALAGGAQDRIASEVRRTIDRCAATTTAQTPGCPFALTVWGQVSAVKWRVTAYPKVSAQPSWFAVPDGVTIADDGTGTVHWSATYTDLRGARQTSSGDAAFRINGVARASSSGIQVTLQ